MCRAWRRDHRPGLGAPANRKQKRRKVKSGETESHGYRRAVERGVGSRGEVRRRPQETQGHNVVCDEPVAESGSV